MTSLRQRDKSVNFNWLHEVGSSCDDTELPDHVSSAEEIGDLVVAVKRFLVSLPNPPCIITVARFVPWMLSSAYLFTEACFDVLDQALAQRQSSCLF